MSRDELLNDINEKLIDEEAEHSIEECDSLVSSGIDSFGITMVIVSIDEEYEIYGQEEFKNIDFEHITAKEIIDKIKAKDGSN